MKSGLIYCLICPKTNHPKYVGQTTRKLSSRLNEHKYKQNLIEKINYKNHYKNWIAILQREDLIDNLSIQLLGEYNVDELDFREHQWIQILENYNYKLTNTLRNPSGWGGYLNEHSQNIRRLNLSKTLTGKPKSKPFSDKHKLAISKSLIGNTRRTGIKCTDEMKINISEGRKGIPAYNRQKIFQYNKNFEFIKEWESIQEAQQILNVFNLVSASSDDGRKYAGGFIWVREKDKFPNKFFNLK